MSGPITCGYLITHALLLLSARALREARAMKQEYGQVLAQLRDRELAVAQARQGQRAARLERITAVRHEVQRQSARLGRLQSLAQSLATQMPELAQQGSAQVPAAPTRDDDAAWTAHLRALDTAVRDLEALLGQAGGARAGAAALVPVLFPHRARPRRVDGQSARALQIHLAVVVAELAVR